MKCNPFILSILLAAPACNSASHQPEHEVDKGMVAHLSESEQTSIRDAQQREAEARDQLVACQAATKHAKGDLDVAKQELAVAEAEVKKTELNMKAAESGTTDDVNKANEAHNQALALPEAAHARIVLRERQIDRAKAREDLASKRVDLAVTNVELERAKAVKSLDRPDAKKVDLAKYEDDQRKAQEAVDIAKVKLDAAGKETDIARSQYKMQVGRIPASYRASWSDDFAEDRAKEALDLEDQMKK